MIRHLDCDRAPGRDVSADYGPIGASPLPVGVNCAVESFDEAMNVIGVMPILWLTEH
jgi:hypothetical protein